MESTGLQMLNQGGFMSFIPIKLEKDPKDEKEKMQTEGSPLPNTEMMAHFFAQHLASIDRDMLEYVPQDILEYLADALHVLYSNKAANIIYPLLKAFSVSKTPSEGFGTDTLLFKVLQLMLVSMFCEDDNADLLASTDEVVPWLLSGLDENQSILDHMNQLLFPARNFHFSAKKLEEKNSIELVNMKDMSIQCQYQQGSEDYEELAKSVCDIDESCNAQEAASTSQGQEFSSEDETDQVLLKVESDESKSGKSPIKESLANGIPNTQKGSALSKSSAGICRDCNEYQSDMSEHIRLKHPRYSCSKCDLGFTYLPAYEKHMAKHEGWTYECPVCGILYDCFQKLKGHAIQKHSCMSLDFSKFEEKIEIIDDDGSNNQDEEAKRLEDLYEMEKIKEYAYKCDKCNKMFSRLYSLKRHKLMLHNIDEFQQENLAVKKKIAKTEKIQDSDTIENDCTASETEMQEDTSQIFYCKICARYFKRRSSLTRHVQCAHNGEELEEKWEDLSDSELFVSSKKVDTRFKKFPFNAGQCNVCKFVATSEEHLSQHKDSKICLSCSICKKEFSTRNELANHRKMKHMKPPITCAFCEQKFTHRFTLFKHFKGQNCVCCLVCSMPFASPSELEEHKSTHPDKGLTACLLCDHVFQTVRRLNQHYEQQHGIVSKVQPSTKCDEGQVMFPCDGCESSFSFRDELITHKKSEHPQVKKGFLCSLCGSRFLTQRTLDEHMNNHTGDQPFSCDQCDENFSQKKNLKCHIRSVHKEDLCPYCGEKFKGAILKRHLRMEHADELGTKLFHCTHPGCSKKYGWEHELRKHIDTAHKGVRKYVCTICAKAFKTSTHLASHMATHDKKPRFKCHVCGELFIHRPSLKRHLVRHIAEKAFPCPLCSSKFDNMEYLQRHCKLTHRGQKVDLPKFKNPGTSMINEMRIRSRGGRKPNTGEVVIPQMVAGQSGGQNRPGRGGLNPSGSEAQWVGATSLLPGQVKQSVLNAQEIDVNDQLVLEGKKIVQEVEGSLENFVKGARPGSMVIEVKTLEGESKLVSVPDNVQFLQLNESLLQKSNVQ